MFRIYPQSALREFHFCDDQAVYTGASLSGKLHKLIAEYSSNERIKAISLACLFEQEGADCLVSAGAHGTRKVWVDIRSDFSPLPLLRFKS